MTPSAELAQRLRAAAYLEGDFVLSSGQRSRYYLDKYLFETDPALLADLAAALAELLPPDTQRIACVPLGGIPLATALSLRTGLPTIIVRKEAKGYGTAKALEGRYQPGERVVLVEDVLTTASQALQAAATLRELGLVVNCILYVVDRQQGAEQNIRQAGYQPAYLFTAADLGITPSGAGQ